MRPSLAAWRARSAALVSRIRYWRSSSAREHLGERAAAARTRGSAFELSELPGKRAAEDPPQLGRGDEIALRAELVLAAAVVGSQGELHVAGDEIHPPAAAISARSSSSTRESNLESARSWTIPWQEGGARHRRRARVGAAIARRLHAAGACVLVHRDSEADAARLASELNATRAKSAAKVKAELLAPVAPRALVVAALKPSGGSTFS